MTRTPGGSGPTPAAEGDELLRGQRVRPELRPRATGPLPSGGTRTPVPSPLPHPCPEPLPARLCPSPRRTRPPPTSPPPGQSPRPAGPRLSPPRRGGGAEHSGSGRVHPASSTTLRPRARAHPAAAFSNLSASVSSMMRLFTSSRIMAAAAPGRERRNKGGEGGQEREGHRERPCCPLRRGAGWGRRLGKKGRGIGMGGRGRRTQWLAHRLAVETPTH